MDFTDPNILSDLPSPYIRICNDLEVLICDDDLDANFTTNRSFQQRVETSKSETTSINVTNNNTSSITQPSNNSVNNQEQSRALWLGNLDPTTEDADLKSIFSVYGPIESVRILHHKDCAFVNFVQVKDAVMAKDSLNGTPIGNTVVRIRYGKADALNDAKANSTSNDGSNGSAVQSKSVWVGNLSNECKAEHLEEAFAAHGQVESCRVLEGKHCAFVNFSSAEEADRARAAMNGVVILNSPIKTGYAKAVTTSTAPITSTIAAASNNQQTLQNAQSSSIDDLSDQEQQLTEQSFAQPFRTLPVDHMRLPLDFSNGHIRDYRKRLESYQMNNAEVSQLAEAIMPWMLPISIDPVGNILLQRLLERGGVPVTDMILQGLTPFIATIGVHKNGTWAVQKLIKYCETRSQQRVMASNLSPHVVPLLQDQFGNYVVQCCLTFGSENNQFISNALYQNCKEIATSRFGSRAMKSCLESAFLSKQQQDHVVMAVISHAGSLVNDVNGIIILQWLLDSEVANSHAFLAPVFAGRYAELATSKTGSALVLRMLHAKMDQSVKKLMMQELFANDAVVEKLVNDPLGLTVITRAFMESDLRPEDRIGYAHMMLPHLKDQSSLKAECLAAVDMVRMEESVSSDTNSILSRTLRQGLRASTHAVGGPVLK